MDLKELDEIYQHLGNYLSPATAGRLYHTARAGIEFLKVIKAADDMEFAANRIYKKYGIERDWQEWLDLRDSIEEYKNTKDKSFTQD